MKVTARRWLGVMLTLVLFGAVLFPFGNVVLADGETVVIFQIGSRIYTVDGQRYEMDVAPRVDPNSNRTLLPVRYAATAMNASVYWNEEGQQISVVHNETQRVLELAVGEEKMLVSDSDEETDSRRLDQAPVIDPPGRTMLPIRAVAEALYGRVSFDPDTNQIIIVRPANQPPTREPAPAELDFGGVLPMDHQRMETHGEHVKQIPVTNRGEGPLFVDGVGFAKGEVLSLCSRQFEPFVLQPGESRSIAVCVESERPGEFEDVVRFESRVRAPNDLIIKPIRIRILILGCKVSITGGGLRPNIATTGSAPLAAAGFDTPVVNVGQQMSLTASVSGMWGPYTYQWNVPGTHIKDYQELTTAAWSTTAMAPADYTNSSLSYYWKALGNFIVSVRVTNALGFSCTAARSFTVERNGTNIDRQAEDFYTWNHNSATLTEHSNWHSAHPYIPCAAGGSQFFTFHRAYLGRFNSWRAEFGYPGLAPWNPATPLPGGLANNHASRTPYNPAAHILPTYLTVAGGAAVSPCWGKTSKGGFANADQFWREVEGPFHNSVHGDIGGDMGWTTRAPKDPIFWRFHLYVDGL
ncbi:MAG TPA: stalk domain-containing protein [Symbiobacteriaceae bacterium]|nr:stalk domain-containing protein [Symbiobacteriaceae bacterium]